MSTSTPTPVLLPSLNDILSSNPSLSAGIRNLGANPDLAVEAILLLCAGAPCPSWVVPQPLPDEWNAARTRLLSAFESVAPDQVATLKRPRASDPLEASITATAKKPKLIDDADDPPIFTLHGISITSPIRKKADISVRRTTLRFTDPKDPTSNLCDPIPIRNFRHGFIVSTPGKTKPHWTTIILPEAANDQSVIFGCDATVTTSQNTTKYPSPPQSHAKGTPTKPLIHSLFAYFPSGPDGLVDLYEPKPTDFQSVLGSGQCVDAYIGAKDGHLHFFSNGVLWGEKKPCLWFPLEYMVDMHTGVSSGRSFTLYISTRLKSQVGVSNVAGKTEDADDEPLEMHDFSLIDSKEEAPIKKWIADHKQQFAAQTSKDPSHGVGISSSSAASVKGKGKPSSRIATARTTGPIRLMDAAFNDSDPEDQDFAADSDSDSNSNLSSPSATRDDGDDAEGDPDDDEDHGPYQGRAGDRSSDEEMAEDADELGEEHLMIPIPAGMKVSSAAQAEAENMAGEAFEKSCRIQ